MLTQPAPPCGWLGVVDFEPSAVAADYTKRMRAFLDEKVLPAEAGYESFRAERRGTPQEWDLPPVVEELKAEAKKAGLSSTISFPTTSVAGKAIDTGAKARAFAGYMRIHALEASGGLTFAEMGRFVAKPGAPANFTDGHGATSDPNYALVDSTTKQPIDNGARNLWVTETALSTALNTSYMAEQISLFGIVMGIALLLAGIGFSILAIGGALRNPETAFSFLHKTAPHSGGVAA